MSSNPNNQKSKSSENPRFSLKKRFQSFPYAMNGVRLLIQNTHNAWVHLFAAVLAIILGFVLEISRGEWMLIIIVIGLVLALEAVNSALEILCDFVSPEKHDQIKKIKDLSAGAVLIAALTSFIVGLMIFLPKIDW
ncbi:MAG: diacylglycerol kinase family protein [Crocinitomicaceae bacterium]|nr:diacylglycerol kinase family protein [Crocinitomicaceae bacterium]